MQTFDQHLMDLVREGLVAYDVAMAAATRPSDFDLQMRTLSGQNGGASGSAKRPGGAEDDAPSDGMLIGTNLFGS
jgi:twitching motility protein PilT